MALKSLIFTQLSLNSPSNISQYKINDNGRALRSLKLCFDNFWLKELDKLATIDEYDFDYDDINQCYQTIKDVEDHFGVFMGTTTEMPHFFQNIAKQVEHTIVLIIKQLKVVAQRQFNKWDSGSVIKRRAKKWIVYEGEELE